MYSIRLTGKAIIHKAVMMQYEHLKHCIILIQLKQKVITMYSYKFVCKSCKYNVLYIMHVLKYTYYHCLIKYFIMTIKLILISLTITVKLINPILTA